MPRVKITITVKYWSMLLLSKRLESFLIEVSIKIFGQTMVQPLGPYCPPTVGHDRVHPEITVY